MKVYRNFDLTNYNSYRIKAICSKAYFPENCKEVIDIYEHSSQINKIILGNGNNVILSKVKYQEEFIIFNGNFDKVEIHNSIVTAQAGATMERLSNLALEYELTGLEIYYDIPSSVGGAVVMNAGASGEEIKDVLIKVKYLDLNRLDAKEIDKNKIDFEYRNSFFQKNPDSIILQAWFELKKGNKALIREKMNNIKKSRWLKQPRDYPSAGSVFKRPTGHYVGQMIEELGLKGESIGGAMVSKKHGGFIINTGTAKGEDIIKLVKIIQEKVMNSYKVKLELEQRVI